MLKRQDVTARRSKLIRVTRLTGATIAVLLLVGTAGINAPANAMMDGDGYGRSSSDHYIDFLAPFRYASKAVGYALKIPYYALKVPYYALKVPLYVLKVPAQLLQHDGYADQGPSPYAGPQQQPQQQAPQPPSGSYGRRHDPSIR